MPDRIAGQNRRLHAEWEPLAAVWLAWPHNLQTWPGHFDRIPSFFADFACRIARTVPVRIIGDAANIKLGRIHVVKSTFYTPSLDVGWLSLPTNDCWIRDYGPVWVHDETRHRPLVIDFAYNAWGGKYPPWDDDANVARKIATELDHACESSQLCLEGGALETDGRGRLLTTKSCLITPTRNPGWTQESIAKELHARLGVTEIVWLEGLDPDVALLDGDDTDGHIDQLARFVDETNIVVAAAHDETDDNHGSLEHIYRQVKLWADSTSPRIQVHRLPAPPSRSVAGQRVPESYCNFLRLGPDRLLLPRFGSPQSDAAALHLMQNLLPTVDMETLDCRDVVWGLGALHCASRDQPQF